MPALQAERLDVRAGGLRHPQPVQSQQRDQSVLLRRAEPGGHQQGADLVAVQPGRMGLVVQAGRADVHSRGVVQQLFLDGILVEPRDGAQPSGDGGPCSSSGFEVSGEALDVRTTHLEQAHMVLLAPAGELAQVQCVGLTGQAGVAGQESG